MRRHYQNDHHLDMSFACLIFPCEEEFLAWKYEEETNARCSFSRYRSYKIQKSKYVDFFCSRSGFYKDKNHGLRGRRFIGSKKINACCPAQIKVKYLNDEITVKYLRTHVGHDNKLCYMNLTKVNHWFNSFFRMFTFNSCTHSKKHRILIKFSTSGVMEVH